MSHLHCPGGTAFNFHLVVQYGYADNSNNNKKIIQLWGFNQQCIHCSLSERPTLQLHYHKSTKTHLLEA